ncbi:MAG: hypothetical protein FJ146_08160 [Deltaproteobacteria bacterium]|nr:hypothetical protein [Deltaproteobacteria bacterium]
MMHHVLKLTVVICLAASCGGESAPSGSHRVKGIGACEAGHLATQCHNRSVCRLVCAVGGAAASAATGGSTLARAGTAGGAQVCSELCSEVPQCSEVYICDRYEMGGP